MNTIKFWKCKTCKRVLKRAMFPKYFDANTPCADCVTGKTSAISTDPAAAAVEPATIRPRPQRRNGTDNRNID